MKAKKVTLGMETLSGRTLMSASPLGEIAAPEPVPFAGQTVRLRIASTNNGSHALYHDVSIPSALAVADIDQATTSGGTLKYNFSGIEGAAGEAAAKTVVRWEKIAVPVVEEGAAAGGIISEGQGYAIAVATRGAGGIVSEGQGYGI